MDSGDFVYDSSKTYLVIMAYFFQQGQNRTFIPLDVIDCTSQDLQNYKCLDFSKVSNYTFALNTKENLYSQIQIFTYGCRDIDKVKTTIPENCASQDEIDELVNGVNVGLRYKMYTAQYNTTSQQMQSDYRNILVYTFGSQATITFLNMQTQTTSVKQGLVVQSYSYYSSPMQYSQINQSMDRKSALSDGQGPLNSFILQMDEIVYQIQIQYTTLPQILAIVNGVFSLLMIIGYVGRKYSQKQINENFLLLFSENIFPATYFKFFKANKQIQYNQNTSNITQCIKNTRNALNNKQIRLDIEENSNQNQNESNKIIKTDQNENTLELNVNRKFSMENEQNDQINHLPTFEVKLKGSLQFSQSNQYEFNPLNLSSQQQKQPSQLNKFKKYDQEDILKFNDESKLQDEQLVLQYYESNNQSQNQSFIQNQSFQKTSPYNCLLLNENINQSCLQTNNFNVSNVSTILKAIDSKKQLKTKHSTENCQNRAQKINITENQSLNLIVKTKKQRANQMENISKQNLQIIMKQEYQNLLNYIIQSSFYQQYSQCLKKQEAGPLELSSQQKKIIYDQIANDLNIFSLYKDIIFLKKAMMILFNHEQLAAIKHLGCSLNYLNLIRDNNDLDLQKINQLSKFIIMLRYKINYFNIKKEMEKKINFLDEQFITYQSQKLQQQQTEQLLVRIQNKENVSEIDERIVSSLL